MKSATPKVLHPLGGRPLVAHALRAAREVGPEHLVVVLRHQAEVVAGAVQAADPDVTVALQDDVPGTGRAVQCGLEALPAGLTGTVLVTYGDVPLLSGETLARLVQAHTDGGNAMTVLTAELADPTGYGRVLRDEAGVSAIVEQKDATEAQRRCARSTPASTRSRPPPCGAPWPGSVATTRPGRSTSPTCWPCCAPTAAASRPSPWTTSGRSAVSTTAPSSPSSPPRPTAARCAAGCSPA